MNCGNGKPIRFRLGKPANEPTILRLGQSFQSDFANAAMPLLGTELTKQETNPFSRVLHRHDL